MGHTSPEAGRSARKRRAILQAATTVFLEKGYLGTSMDEVAALAAVSKQTVYKHFADKERLFGEMILGTVTRVADFLDAAVLTLRDTSDLDKDLRLLARRFIAGIMQPDALRLRRLVIGEAGRFPELGRSWYERGFERALATLAATLRHLDGRGLLRVEDPAIAADHFAGLLLWIPVNRVMFCGETATLTEADAERFAEAGVTAFLAAYGRE